MRTIGFQLKALHDERERRLMGYIHHDSDEWKSVHTSTPCHSCGGDMSKCNGRCTGSSSFSLVRRSDEEIREIKRQKREAHENQVLAEADIIRARRATRAI